jgi:uncharacterized protein (DUF305 family)
MKLRRLAAPSITLVLTATLAACGGGDDTSSPTLPAATGPAADTAADAGSDVVDGLNEADVAFAQGMIAHHEQAIEMAEIALDPTVGARAEVVDLATRIRAAQGPEVDTMTDWLSAADAPVQMDTSDGHEMSEMEGMMTAEDMDALAAMTAEEFDRTWLEMMIVHHEGAIAQSQTVKTDGSNPDVLALADRIIAAQQAEITEMQALLDG